MADCRLCGLKAGVFKSVHDQCLKDAETATEKLKAMMTRAVQSVTSVAEVLQTFTLLKREGRLKDDEVASILLSAANKAALSLAHEQPVSNQVLEDVGNLYSAAYPTFLTGGVNFKDYPGFISLTFSNTLYQVLHGETPYFDSSKRIDFRLSSDERPILRRNTRLAEYRNNKKHGQSQSISLPVGGGIYYRFNVSSPRVEETVLSILDEGEMLITTGAIYFGGLRHTLRIPHSSIIRLQSLADGLGIHQQNGTGNILIPASLGFDDGWFFYNLVAALAARTADIEKP